MRKYLLMIQGKNILVQFGNRKEKWGFFTTRFAKGKNLQQAEDIALKEIREELREVVLNDPSDVPMMYILEATESSSWKSPVKGRGFSWYPENSEEWEMWSEETTQQ